MGLAGGPDLAAVPLLEREDDVAAIEALLDGARAAQGGLLILRGPGGAGKTTLLDVSAAAAEERGLRVLRAGGDPLEQELAYAVVSALLEPALRDPALRAAVVAGPAVHAAAVLGLVDDAGPAPGDVLDPVARMQQSLRWLFANLAAEGPLVVVVDDAQWADAASLRFLTYLARRLDEVPAALVLATRPALEGASADLIEQLLVREDARLRELGPLSRAAAEDLVAAALGSDVPEEVVERCHEVTGGNPFLLRELLRTLARTQEPPDAERIARSGGASSIARAVLGRVAECGAGAVDVVRALAVLGDEADTRRVAALCDRSLDEVAALADDLVRVAVVATERPLRFAHPIVREAVHADMAAPGLAAAHRRAAEILAADGAEDRAAAHVMLAEPAGDVEAARLLRADAARAVAAGETGLAVARLRRALAEPPEAADRPEIHAELGMALRRAGDLAGAIEHLERALAAPWPPERRFALARGLAQSLIGSGRGNEAKAVIDVHRAALQGDATDLALRLEAELLGAAMLGALDGGLVRERREALDPRAGAATPGERLVLAVVVQQDLFENRPVAEVAARARAALGGGALAHEEGPEAVPLYQAVFAAICAGAHDAARETIAAAQDEARRSGSSYGFVAATTYRTWLGLCTGDIAGAEADGRAAYDALVEHHGPRGLPSTAAYFAGALILRDEAEQAREVLDSLGLEDEVPWMFGHFQVLIARGVTRVATGMLEAGLADILEAGRRAELLGIRSPAALGWRAYAVAPLLTLGDHERASALAAEQRELAAAFGEAGTLSVAELAVALTAQGPERLDRLQRALALAEQAGNDHQAADTLVEIGATLRRGNERRAAREHLARALDLATRAGALATAERARDELRASGARPRRELLSGVEALTPSELRVATLAAHGRSNPQIAQTLFVSRKTVEKHLGAAYAKLDVGSRAELAPLLLGKR